MSRIYYRYITAGDQASGDQKIRQPSLADKVYELIKNDIITCVLEPGQQVAQPWLAERYRVSITPLREAMQRLVQEGFVQTIPRVGYIVSPVTISDVHEIFELRTIIEVAAARFAVSRAPEDELARIARMSGFTYVYGDWQSYAEFYAQNTVFHRSIALAANNQRMVDLLSKLLDEMQRIFHLGLDLRDSAEEMRDEHIDLARALCDRDPDRAEQLARGQIERSRDRVLEALTSRNTRVGSRGLSPSVQV